MGTETTEHMVAKSEISTTLCVYSCFLIMVFTYDAASQQPVEISNSCSRLRTHASAPLSTTVRYSKDRVVNYYHGGTCNEG